VIDTATHTVTTTVPVGVFPQAFGQFIGPGKPDSVTILRAVFVNAFSLLFVSATSRLPLKWSCS
jgi:DNA-binding beta-propeller fold protein YncE